MAETNFMYLKWEIQFYGPNLFEFLFAGLTMTSPLIFIGSEIKLLPWNHFESTEFSASESLVGGKYYCDHWPHLKAVHFSP